MALGAEQMGGMDVRQSTDYVLMLRKYTVGHWTARMSEDMRYQKQVKEIGQDIATDDISLPWSLPKWIALDQKLMHGSPKMRSRRIKVRLLASIVSARHLLLWL